MVGYAKMRILNIQNGSKVVVHHILLCVYIYIYIYIYVCTTYYKTIHTHICIYIYVCVCAFVQILYVHVSIHLYNKYRKKIMWRREALELAAAKANLSSTKAGAKGFGARHRKEIGAYLNMVAICAWMCWSFVCYFTMFTPKASQNQAMRGVWVRKS